MPSLYLLQRHRRWISKNQADYQFVKFWFVCILIISQLSLFFNPKFSLRSINQDSTPPLVRSAHTQLPQKAGSKCDNGIPLFLHLCFQKREAFTEFFFKTFDPFPQRSPLFAAALGVPVGLVGRAYLILQWDIWKKQPVSTLMSVQVAF